jgi:hypothetical protein
VNDICRGDLQTALQKQNPQISCKEDAVSALKITNEFIGVK